MRVLGESLKTLNLGHIVLWSGSRNTKGFGARFTKGFNTKASCTTSHKSLQAVRQCIYTESSNMSVNTGSEILQGAGLVSERMFQRSGTTFCGVQLGTAELLPHRKLCGRLADIVGV